MIFLNSLLFQADPNDLMRQAQLFLYANGNDHPPTAIDLDKSLLRDLLFNLSPAKVCFLHDYSILDSCLSNMMCPVYVSNN